jgi:hypothetical protein
MEPPRSLVAAQVAGQGDWPPNHPGSQPRRRGRRSPQQVPTPTGEVDYLPVVECGGIGFPRHQVRSSGTSLTWDRLLFLLRDVATASPLGECLSTLALVIESPRRSRPYAHGPSSLAVRRRGPDIAADARKDGYSGPRPCRFGTPLGQWTARPQTSQIATSGYSLASSLPMSSSAMTWASRWRPRRQPRNW